MSFFESVYNKVFKRNSPANKVILHEVIKRSSKYHESFNQWKNSARADSFLQHVSKAYEFKKMKIRDELEVHVLDSDYSNGFAITYNPYIDINHFQYFFDLLAERVNGAGYFYSNSDLMISEKINYLEAKEKHYLKPRQEKIVNPIVQKYGNVLIEYVKIDDKPSFIRLMANIYSDRLYEKAYDFSDLIQILFKTKG